MWPNKLTMLYVDMYQPKNSHMYILYVCYKLCSNVFSKQIHTRSKALHYIIYMHRFRNLKCVVPITTLPPTKHQPLKDPHTMGHDTTHASRHVGIDCSTTISATSPFFCPSNNLMALFWVNSGQLRTSLGSSDR